MCKIIFNADDFGLSRAINYGIIDSYTEGILTSTTIMANMPGFDHAVSLAKENPGLGVGIHLTLTAGKPVLNTHQTLVDENGNFKKLDFFESENEYSLDEVRDEWEAQIKKVYESGVKITHIDSHHHVHSFPKQQQITIDLARKYELPVRSNFSLPSDIKTVERFETNFDTAGNQPESRIETYLDNLLEDIKQYNTIEVMCHPGYLDDDVLNISSLKENRVKIANFIMNSNFSNKMKTNSEIELISYRDLKKGELSEE